jgi:ComF family protein
MSCDQLIAGVKSSLDAALSFFYPQCCQICGQHRATPKEGYVCESCRARPDGVRFVRPPLCDRCGFPYQGEITGTFACANCVDLDLHFSRARAAVVATDLVLDVIHRYKYRRSMWFEEFLADLLVSQALPELKQDRWDWVVPVPLHPVKRREREFNQAERLAARLGAAAGLPLNTGLLRRVEATQTQTMLNRHERVANVRNAFAPTQKCCLNGERLVLVDDVLTTGATTNACARVLQKAGAGEVCVWTVARGV